MFSSATGMPVGIYLFGANILLVGSKYWQMQFNNFRNNSTGKVFNLAVFRSSPPVCAGAHRGVAGRG